MKQISVISGKGGTGKTTLTASFAVLNTKSVIADCDVDAPDLHILLKPKIYDTEDFICAKIYNIDVGKCINCGNCKNKCRFEAIRSNETGFYIDEYSCEKCGLCEKVCPVNAIYFQDGKNGESYIAETEYGKMVFARLNPGAENSGKLVNVVRQKAETLATSENQDLIIIDGPPGKGCPVISAIANVNAAIIVTEPTVSGISDFTSAAELTKQLKIKTFAVVNKFDINEQKTNEIKKYCAENCIAYLGNINYDKTVLDAINNCVPVMKYADNSTAKQIKSIWENLLKEL